MTAVLENVNKLSKYGLNRKPTYNEIIGMIDDNEKLTGKLPNRDPTFFKNSPEGSYFDGSDAMEQLREEQGRLLMRQMSEILLRQNVRTAFHAERTQTTHNITSHKPTISPNGCRGRATKPSNPNNTIIQHPTSITYTGRTTAERGSIKEAKRGNHNEPQRGNFQPEQTDNHTTDTSHQPTKGIYTNPARNIQHGNRRRSNATTATQTKTHTTKSKSKGISVIK